MSYPILITKYDMPHKGGTKAYSLIFASNADEQAILIYRWGKIGALGQMLVEKHDTLASARQAYDKELRQRERKGYEIGRPISATATNQAELAAAIGRAVIAKIGADALRFLDADADTTGMREPDKVTVDEDGNFLGKAAPRKVEVDLKEVERLKAQKAADEKAALDAAFANNPRFGMF